MRIKEFLDSDDFLKSERRGKKETVQQRYWRLLWADSPVNLKSSLSAFYKSLCNRNDLKYRLVKYDTIRSYYNDFKWEEWYYNELYKCLDGKDKDVILDNQVKILERASEQNEEYSRIIKVIQEKAVRSMINVNPNDPSSVNCSVQLMQTYQNSLNFVNTVNSKFNESYLSTKELAGLNKKLSSSVENNVPSDEELRRVIDEKLAHGSDMIERDDVSIE